MAGYIAREAQPGDAQELARALCAADRQGVVAQTGIDPLEAVQNCVENSLIAVAVVSRPNNAVVGMFGAVVAPDWEETGLLWFLGTGAFTKHLLVESRQHVRAFHHRFRLLVVVVDERHTKHIHWLEQLGFTLFARHEQFGNEQRPFLEYVRNRDNV
jgi:hypothetical protein